MVGIQWVIVFQQARPRVFTLALNVDSVNQTVRKIEVFECVKVLCMFRYFILVRSNDASRWCVGEL